MKRILALGAALFATSALANAGETAPVVVETKESVTCTCQGAGPGSHSTWETKDGKQVVIQGQPGSEKHVVVVTDDDHQGSHGEDVNVQVVQTGNGPEKHVVVIRKYAHDSADENRDGMITRREFMKRAEKHFADMDKNRDGVLSKDEATPPMPPLPELPPLPPIPPVPPAPPAPPAPPSGN